MTADPGWLAAAGLAALGTLDKLLTARASRRAAREDSAAAAAFEPRTDYVDHSLEGLRQLTLELRHEREELRGELAEVRTELHDAARELTDARVQLAEARAEIRSLRMQLAQAGFELATYRALNPPPPYLLHATESAPPA